MSTKTLPRLRAALAFASMGWPVFQLAANSKAPRRGCELCYSKSEKFVPHFGLDDCPHPPADCHSFYAASTEEAVIRERFERFPDSNLAISTAPANLVVIDLDVNKSGEEPPAPYNTPGVVNGWDVFALAIEKYGAQWPGDTLNVMTPSGGLHIYWRLPRGLVVNPSAGVFGWQVDVRAAKSYIIAPTSSTTAGAYRRIGDVMQPRMAPDWVLHHLRGTGHMPEPKPPRKSWPQRDGVQSGNGMERLRKLADKLSDAPVFERHATLCTVTTAAAHLVADGLVTERDVEDELYPAGRAAERSEYEIRTALLSAFTKVCGRAA
jgi:hypothetical protein